jgi:outer membrane protein with beta-barrel domain
MNNRNRIIHSFPAITVLLLSSLLFHPADTYSQSDSQKVTHVLPQPIPQNAGFDVIVKINGEIVYGLVKEVGPYYVSYQRTDIPDGPVYTIPRNEVYVISYRNQVKDYINSEEVGADASSLNDPYLLNNEPRRGRYINYKNKDLFKNGSLRVALGFLKSFSKVENSKDYSTSGGFPVISLGYEVNYKQNACLGVQIGFGSHDFSKQEFSSYDSTKTDVTLKENIFGLYVYGRYYFLNSSSRLQPFVLGGIGIVSSNVHENNTIRFTNDNTQVILVKSGTRKTGLGITARAGADYFISNQMQLFADAGAGLSVINVGLAFSVK